MAPWDWRNGKRLVSSELVTDDRASVPKPPNPGNSAPPPPRPPMAEPRQDQGSPRPSRPGPRLVHRGVRHRDLKDAKRLLEGLK